MTILHLPGVEAGEVVAARAATETAAQLQVRLAALEAENARLRALFNDVDWLKRRVLALWAGRTPPV